MRRVCDFSSTPWRRGWRVISRAVQGLQQLGAFGWAVWSPSEVASALREAVEGLAPGQTCCRWCGGEAPRRCVATFDASQAFEMTPEDEVLAGLSAAWGQFRRVSGCATVSVHRGPRYRVRAGRPTDRSLWWVLGEEQVSCAVWHALQNRFVVFGDQVFSMAGVPIGGIVSCPMLGLALGLREQRHRPCPSHVCCLRFVDDLLVVTSSICLQCVARWVQEVYSGKFTMADAGPGWVPWLDLEVSSRHGSDVVYYRFLDRGREWVLGRAPRPGRLAFSPYLGALPVAFSSLRSVMVGRQRRAEILGCSSMDVAHVLMSMALELVTNGYPLSLVRAAIHSLPKTGSSVVARWAVRALHRASMGRASRRGEHTSGGASGGRKGADGPPRRVRSQRRRPRSPSSESSSDSSGYRRYREEKKKKASEEVYRQQGAALAAALGQRFDALAEALGAPASSPTAGLPQPAAGLAQALSPQPAAVPAQAFSLQSPFAAMHQVASQQHFFPPAPPAPAPQPPAHPVVQPSAEDIAQRVLALLASRGVGHQPESHSSVASASSPPLAVVVPPASSAPQLPVATSSQAGGQASAARDSEPVLSELQCALLEEVLRHEGKVTQSMTLEQISKSVESAMKKGSIAKAVSDYLERRKLPAPRGIADRAKRFVEAIRML